MQSTLTGAHAFRQRVRAGVLAPAARLIRDVGPYHCSLCDMTFPTSQAIGRHRCAVHGMPPSEKADYNFLEHRVDLQLEYPAFVKGKCLRASVLQEAATAVGM